MRNFEENQLYDFIKSIDGSAVKNSTKLIPPYELDVICPDKKIAIEFDGLYWHSEKFKKNRYHIEKTELCNQIGYRLIHIFENEWKDKPEIVKSRLKHIFGKYDVKINARKCTVKKIHPKEAKEFLSKNHLRGYTPVKLSYGLFYKNKLKAVMTFGKPKFTKEYQWELSRFAIKLNHHIPGAASKLFNHFIKENNPVSILSYGDKRYTNGNLYYKLDFKLKKETKPNQWFYNDKTRELTLKKHYITENDKEKILRVFDCGNFIFVKIFQ